VRVYQFRHTGIAGLLYSQRPHPSIAGAQRIRSCPRGNGARRESAAGFPLEIVRGPAQPDPNTEMRGGDGVFPMALFPPSGSAHCSPQGARLGGTREAKLDRSAFGRPRCRGGVCGFRAQLRDARGAWFFEFVLKLPPCPLCLEQRIPYHIVIPLSLLLAIAAFVHAPPKLLAVGFVAIIVAVLCNVVLGTYHAGVEWHFWAGPTDCTGPLTDLNAGGSLLNQLHAVHVVRCDEAAWRFLGISLAGYNVIISLALAAIAACGLFARKRAA
jgi:disulfide bond formation protein DsbB